MREPDRKRFSKGKSHGPGGHGPGGHGPKPIRKPLGKARPQRRALPPRLTSASSLEPGPPKAARQKPVNTHWGEVAEWYDKLVGEEGSEYHREVIFPGVLRLAELGPGEAVVDIACGQGVLCRVMREKGYKATGVDAAPELIQLARQRVAPHDPSIEYCIGDARELTFLRSNHYQAATCILAIQNIDRIQPVFDGVARALVSGGKLILVMMHPAFRGPKYTMWGWDPQQRSQYRRVDRYLLPRKEPIFTHPGLKDGQYTWSFHRPLQQYVKALKQSGLMVDAIEEWPSHKVSTSGPRASAENVARREIPMFMALRAVKVQPRGDERSWNHEEEEPV